MISLFTVDFANIGRQLQQRRRELGLTQDQISNQLSITTTQLSRIECGQRPSLLTLLHLTSLLNLSLDSLFSINTSADQTAVDIHRCLMDLTPDQRLQVLKFLQYLQEKTDPDDLSFCCIKL